MRVVDGHRAANGFLGKYETAASGGSGQPYHPLGLGLLGLVRTLKAHQPHYAAHTAPPSISSPLRTIEHLKYPMRPPDKPPLSRR